MPCEHSSTHIIPFRDDQSLLSTVAPVSATSPALHSILHRSLLSSCCGTYNRALHHNLPCTKYQTDKIQGKPIVIWATPETTVAQARMLCQLAETRMGLVVELTPSMQLVISPQKVGTEGLQRACFWRSMLSLF